MSNESAENDPAWTEACRREEAIRGLLRRYPHRMTKRAVEEVAWELGLGRTTLYLLIGRYRATGTVRVAGPVAGIRHAVRRPGTNAEQPGWMSRDCSVLTLVLSRWARRGPDLCA
jgi:hypothetical protein